MVGGRFSVGFLGGWVFWGRFSGVGLGRWVGSLLAVTSEEVETSAGVRERGDFGWVRE